MFDIIVANVFVYGKLRVCVRGFSEGKSDVANVQRPFDLAKNSNFLYTVLGTVLYTTLFISTLYPLFLNSFAKSSFHSPFSAM